MEILYTKFELLTALLAGGLSGLSKEKFDEQLAEIEAELVAEFSVADRKEFNQRVAEHAGVGVESLVNSPNYELLCDEYGKDIFQKLVKKMVEKMGITEIVAWAMIAQAKGLLRLV